MIKNEYVFGMLVIGFLFLDVTGCEMHSRGAQIFQNNRCNECHTIKGKGGAAGPNLTFIGSKRSRDYIAEQIKNPKSYNANSDMPSFSHLPAQDMDDLADYLSGLR